MFFSSVTTLLHLMQIQAILAISYVLPPPILPLYILASFPSRKIFLIQNDVQFLSTQITIAVCRTLFFSMHNIIVVMLSIIFTCSNKNDKIVTRQRYTEYRVKVKLKEREKNSKAQ